jgi:3-carboxy-cis,cis-muconate cycloisomerase
VALFEAVYGSAPVEAATDDDAWLRAMLQVQRAIAVAGSRVGLIPPDAAAAIAAATEQDDRFDLAAIGRSAGVHATPVIELVNQLRAVLPSSVAGSVQLAATSQDVLDTAAMLVCRRALAPAGADAEALAELLAALAAEHRSTPILGRTLLQPALPTSFGAVCAARLVAVDEALVGLRTVVADRLAVQLGGAVGTLGPAGDRGPALLAQVAAELGLVEPVLPWHTARGRVGQLAAAIGVLAGELAGAAQDVVLLAGLAEVAEAAPGRSSSMPAKQNPARAVLALACAHRVPGLVATLLAGLPQELQRAAGRWQAEAGTLTELLRLLGGTAGHTRAAYEGLQVDPAAMARHLEQAGISLSGNGSDPEVDGRLSSELSPELGSAPVFVDRALAAHAAVTSAAAQPKEGAQ